MWYVIRAVDPVDHQTWYWSEAEVDWVRKIDYASQYQQPEADKVLAHLVKWYSHNMSWFQLMSA